ncbi:MAG: hypothetical protein Q8R40_00200 [bacterium]|nr:hypothetical protein [bacterium]
MKKFKNTIQKGEVRLIVFRERNTWYGVALEFNIVEEGEQPQEVLLRLMQAVEGYLESAKKIKARPHVLNQKPDLEYEELWKKLEQSEGRKPVIPYQIYHYGRQLIPA